MKFTTGAATFYFAAYKSFFNFKGVKTLGENGIFYLTSNLDLGFKNVGLSFSRKKACGDEVVQDYWVECER